MVKAKEFYLTEKGQNFNWEDPKYLEEEKGIMEVLESGRKSINQIMTLVEIKLKMPINWYAIEKALLVLEKEGFVEEMK